MTTKPPKDLGLAPIAPIAPLDPSTPSPYAAQQHQSTGLSDEASKGGVGENQAARGDYQMQTPDGAVGTVNFGASDNGEEFSGIVEVTPNATQKPSESKG